MSTATLSNVPATQLTFPWAVPIAEAVPLSLDSVSYETSTAERLDSSTESDSLQSAICDDRIGKPFRIGAVMFRLLKRYGISDAEIAEGIATYTAKNA